MSKIITLLFFFATSIFANAQTGTVQLIVKGIQTSKGGEISAGIFQEENFPKVGKQLLGKEVLVTANEMKIIFENVPIGVYGIVAFQDIDKDKKLKSNFIGFPTEPIGFSRDAKIKFGPPAFDDAKVIVENNKILSLTILLK